MSNRVKSGKCVAIKDYDRITYKKGIANSLRIFNKNEIFSFELEDGWLYKLEDDNENKIAVQYALFDKYFEIMEN